MKQRRFSLPLYLLIVFGLSWPFQIISILGPRTLLWADIFNSLTMIMVGVATFICARFIFRDGLSGAGWRWGGGKYWVAAIGIPALLWIVPTVLDVCLGNLHLPRKLTPSQIGWVCEMLFVTLIPAFGEEIGWRGYMLPRMVRTMSPRKAVVWHGVIWYVWHWPLVGYASYMSIKALSPELSLPLIVLMTFGGLAVGSIVVILQSAIFAWIWAASGSIVIATVLHAAYDGFRDSLSLTIGSGPIGSAWSSLMLVVIGAIMFFKADWRKLLSRRLDPAELEH